MTAPDLDALDALLRKNPHTVADMAQAMAALPGLLARLRAAEAALVAADAMREWCDPVSERRRNMRIDYDAARANVKIGDEI